MKGWLKRVKKNMFTSKSSSELILFTKKEHGIWTALVLKLSAAWDASRHDMGTLNRLLREHLSLHTEREKSEF